MSKKYYALRLIPSRPDFAMLMSDDERGVMQQHAAYLKEHMKTGVGLVFGPVLDPAGVYGLGIVAVDSRAQLKNFINDEPTAAIDRYVSPDDGHGA